MLEFTKSAKVCRIPISFIMGSFLLGASSFMVAADEPVFGKPLLVAFFEQPPSLQEYTSGIAVTGTVNSPSMDNLMGTMGETYPTPKDQEVFVNFNNVLLQMGAPKSRPIYSRDFSCLVEALYFEARGESLEGQRAVAEVIIHRVQSIDFPNTICGVVHQGGIKMARCQFSYYCDGKPEIFYEKNAYQQVRDMAKKFVGGHYPEIFAEPTHFHATHVRPFWVSELEYLGQAGRHHFYSH